MSRRDSGPESSRSTSTSRALSVPATFSAVRNRHDTAFILRGRPPKSMPVWMRPYDPPSMRTSWIASSVGRPVPDLIGFWAN